MTGNEARTPPSRRSTNRLHTVEGCRREIARLAREAIWHERDSLEASRIAQIIHLVARLIEGGDLERRLEDLEERQREQAQRLGVIQRLGS